MGAVRRRIVGTVGRRCPERNGRDLRVHVDQHLVTVGAASRCGQLHHAGLVRRGAKGVVRNSRRVVAVPLPGAERARRGVDVGDVAVGRAEGVPGDADGVVLAVGRGRSGDRLRLRIPQADAADGGLQRNVLRIADASTA